MFCRVFIFAYWLLNRLEKVQFYQIIIHKFCFCQPAGFPISTWLAFS